MESYNLSNTTLVTKEYFEELKRKEKVFNRIVEVYSDTDLYTDEDVLQVIADELDELERADDDWSKNLLH